MALVSRVVQNHKISLYNALKSDNLGSTLEALDHCQRMGMPISDEVLQYVLEECMKRKDVSAARRVHVFTIHHGLCLETMLGDHLIRLFGSSGSLIEADVLFCMLTEPTVYTWQALISAHSSAGLINEVIYLFYKMQQDGVMPDKVIFLCMLKACSKEAAAKQGKLVHKEIVTHALESDVTVGSSLIDVYAKCGCLLDAHSVFDMLADRNEVSWGAMITGCVKNGDTDFAFQLFVDMQKENVQPTKVILLSILKACSSAGALIDGRTVHSHIISDGLESDLMIANTLIDMYGKCGSLKEAYRLFISLPLKSEASWGALVAGFFLHEESCQMLKLLDMIEHDSVEPNIILLLYVLKACSDIGAASLGKLVHDNIIRSQFDLDIALGNSLIDMYAKCGYLEEGHKVFDALPNRDIVSWGAMISGYIKHGDSSIALELLNVMIHQDIQLNVVIFPCALRACSEAGDMWQGKVMHHLIIKDRFDSDVVVGNALVDMYAKFGSIYEAHKVFEMLTSRNIVSWSAIIAGYAQQEQCLYALELFKKMQEEGLDPNQVTFLSVLKACGNTGSLACGRWIHEKIVRCGFDTDLMIANTLVDMYCKCRNVEAAREVFERISNPDGVTWSTMIVGYSQADDNATALELFEKMEKKGFKANDFVFPCILRACSSMGDLWSGKLVHDQIIRHKLAFDVVIGSALVDMYAKCGSLGEAWSIFDTLACENEVLWGTMIDGYAQHGFSHLALELFSRMLDASLKPDRATFLCVLRACANMFALRQGHLVHELIVRSSLDLDPAFGSSVIDMYGKCGSLTEAHKVFDGFLDPDVVLWGSMIAAYAHHDCGLPALELFSKMQNIGVKLNKVIYLCLLKVCSSMEAMARGKLIHDQIVQDGLDSDVTVGNKLVDMYSKSGSLEDAQQVFKGLSKPDRVSWSALVTGYSQQDQGLHALELFEKMQQEGIDPCGASFLCALKTCGSMGALQLGRLVHHHIISTGLESDIMTGNTLMNMYANCASLEDAYKLFDRLPHKEEESWSVMIAGYAQHGMSRLAEQCLEYMKQQGLKPQGMLYSNIFSGFSHEGLVRLGGHHFTSMEEELTLLPSIEHCNCIVDLLGRAGFLKQAEQFLKTMPIPPTGVSWMSLLTACKTYGNDELGQHCFDEVVELGSETAAGYMLMSNVCADTNRWEDVEKVKELRRGISAWRKPGRAWIELENGVYDFMVGQREDLQGFQMSLCLNRLRNPLKAEGYVPNVHVVVEQFVDGEGHFVAGQIKDLPVDLELLTPPAIRNRATTEQFPLCIPAFHTSRNVFYNSSVKINVCALESL